MSFAEDSSQDVPKFIGAMLKVNAARFGPRPAIMAQGVRSLSHEELYSQVIRTIQALRRRNIRQGDRVAIALSPGPELAVAFLAVAAGATSAPLNPGYRESDFEFNLKDLSAKALIVFQGSDSPAVTAAKKLGVEIIEVELFNEGEDRSLIQDSSREPTSVFVSSDEDFAGEDDVALVLHTSGTTSRPKRVPLCHGNLCASAHNIARALKLNPEDVSLSVMPLFHIHGLGCLLAALSAGGSCVCVRAFEGNQFSSWLAQWKPTWVSAVPTILQAILDASRRSTDPNSSLRFIRSSSAALPRSVMAGLEEVFGVPVIEAYGMTEAAHQMASNPLPPRKRKAGSVGVPAGPTVVILDEQGTPLSCGGSGEVAIAGANVTSGYENHPEANAAAFSGEWFRTGDQGHFDEDGYLFITGRLKEQINRGGEKVVPREIDEALLTHPSVREAVAFAVPHESLGEDIAAAVVLVGRESTSETALRDFLFDHLAAFKVPSRVIIVDAIPKGPTGKIQRIGMAGRLSKHFIENYQPPASEMEIAIAEIIGTVLGRERIGREDNFFMLGGDSLRGTQVLVRLQQRLNLELPVSLLFRLPTLASFAARLEELVASSEIDALAAALSELPLDEQERLLEEAERAVREGPLDRS